MSSDSEEYYSEEEGSVVSESTSGRNSKISKSHSSSNVTVLDTESDDDSVARVIKRKRRAVIISDSEEEEEEEEDELDQRGVSPRTRMSITGVRPQDLSDDSSDIDYSEEEQPSKVNRSAVYKLIDDVADVSRNEAEESSEINKDSDASKSDDSVGRVVKPKAAGRRRAVILSDSEEEEEEDELDRHGLSPRTRRTITGVRPKDTSNDSSEIDYRSAVDQMTEAVPGSMESSGINEDEDGGEERDSDHYPTAADNHDDLPRYSTQFVNNSKDMLHSTIVPIAQHQQEEQEQELPPTRDSSNNSSGSDVLILSNNKEKTIEISSSSSDNSFNNENQSPNINSKESPHSIVDPPKLVNVSHDFYEQELRKVAELRVQLSEAEKLFEKVAHKLPDKGDQIRKRIDGLRADIAKRTKYLDGVNVQKGITPKKVPPPRLIEPPKPADKELDWDDLSAAVNLIQPKHTGTQGLATFNNQKALTVDSLKDLHGSLKDCPAESVLADEPVGLKVQLMDHQRHALAWMTWREQQRPRGGILADDMGLGKTLTMISLVLDCKNRQESNTASQPQSASSDEDEQNPRSAVGWNSKGRKDHRNGGTLVVCPASLIRQWESEVNSKLSRHRLTVCVHHGTNRESKSKNLSTYDLVVTTYNIVTREQKTGSALFGVKWRRIILDEAHVVRNYKSQSSLAVSALRSKFRWALTGTPIQNKELDVYALLKFLRCSPFDDLQIWQRWINNKSAGGQERLNLLIKSIMLRRTKIQLQSNGKLNNLPNKRIQLVEMHLDKYEMNVYQRILTYSRSLFAQFLHQRSEKDSDMNFNKMHEKFSRMAGHDHAMVKSHEILVLLLRLRQICCHPGLIDTMLEDNGTGELDHENSHETSAEIDLLDHLNKLTINESSHSNPDESRIVKASQNVLKRSNPVFDFKRPSTKLLKTMEILKTCVLNTDDKVIIVSQWTSVLNILRDMLDKEGLKSLSLNGTIQVKNRQDIVNEFNDPRSSKRILLLSLTAGGVGLNLIGANHLILLDLHWNPQLEAQAQDRIYRVGQKKDVIIYKMICMDTVEQRIKLLQDRKLELADGLLTGKVSTKLSIDDLKGLFEM